MQLKGLFQGWLLHASRRQVSLTCTPSDSSEFSSARRPLLRRLSKRLGHLALDHRLQSLHHTGQVFKSHYLGVLMTLLLLGLPEEVLVPHVFNDLGQIELSHHVLRLNGWIADCLKHFLAQLDGVFELLDDSCILDFARALMCLSDSLEVHLVGL